MAKTWSEIFGNYVTAAVLIKAALDADYISLAEFLKHEYTELYPNDEREIDFEAIAREVKADARADAIATRTETIRIRVTPSEKAEIQAAAESVGCSSVSEYIRLMLQI